MINCKHYASAALQRAYGGQNCQTIVHHHRPATAHEASSNLPFTGSDIKLFVIVGLVLLVAGIVLARAGRKDRSV